MQRRTDTGTVTVPDPDPSTLAVGTLRSIMRQSGLIRELFESWDTRLMALKRYQERVVREVKCFLEALKKEQDAGNRYA
jgi:hypothetical protein